MFQNRRHFYYRKEIWKSQILKKTIFVFITILFFSGDIIFAPSRKKDENDLGRVKILDGILKNQNEYGLFLADDFEGRIPWKIFRGISFLNKTEFISKTPESEAFALEQKIYFSKFKNESRNSLMLHSYIETPGKHNLDLHPSEKIRLPPGVPIRFFIWVFSNDYNMNLQLIVSQEKSKDIYFDVGNLRFEGWRRLESSINVPPKNIKLHLSLQVPIEVKGLRIEPSPYQKKGVFFIYFDQMGFLLEKRNSVYPGSEVKDNWGFEY